MVRGRARFPPYGLSLHDMADNVWQRYTDWYRPDYDLQSPSNDPTGPSDSFDPAEPGARRRVQRGGSFPCSDQNCSRHARGPGRWGRRHRLLAPRLPLRPLAARGERPEIGRNRGDTRMRIVPKLIDPLIAHADLTLGCRRAEGQAQRRLHPRR